MVEHAQFSPSEQVPPQWSRIDRFALRRLSHLALRLPQEPFIAEDRSGTVHVEGLREKYTTKIQITESLEQLEDPVTRETDIEIKRSEKDLFVVTGLTVDQHDIDDFAETHGLERPRHKTFSLDDADNDFSMWDVMTFTGQALRTVNRSKGRNRSRQPVDIHIRYPQ